MYTYERFKTSKSAVTVLVIALAAWGILGSIGTPLAKRGGGGKAEATFTFEYSDNMYDNHDLFDLGGLQDTAADGDTVFNVQFVNSDLSGLGCTYNTPNHRRSLLQIMYSNKRDSNEVVLQYWFADTVTDAAYVLRMSGEITEGEWLPTNTATVAGFGDWEISLTKGKNKNREGVCQGGSGSGLDWTLTITRE